MATVAGKRREAGQGRDTTAIEMAELWEIGDQGIGRDRTNPRGGAQQVFGLPISRPECSARTCGR